MHVEKMLQSVATTDVNGMLVHYEVDTKTGVIITAPKPQRSSYILFQTPV